MKNNFLIFVASAKNLALALLAFLLCCNCRAQEMEEVFSTENYIDQIVRNGNNYYLRYIKEINGYDDGDEHLLVLNDKFQPTDTILLDKGVDGGLNASKIMRFCDGHVGSFIESYTNDTLFVSRLELKENNEIDTLVYDWISVSYAGEHGKSDWIECKDGSVFFVYTIDSLLKPKSQAFEILKFGTDGQLLNNVVLDNVPFLTYPRFHILPTQDSLGLRIVMPGTLSPVKFDCCTFDSELNLVARKENIDNLSYPYLTAEESSTFCTNPYNGRTYSSSIIYFPGYNQNPEIVEDVFISMFDTDDYFTQIGYTWGLHTHGSDSWSCITFDDNGGVYIVAGMDTDPWFSTNIYFAYLDENLQKYNEFYHIGNIRYNISNLNKSILAPNGDLLFTCYNRDYNTNVLMIIPHNSFLGIEEAHAAGFAVATAYPNPGTNVMNIRTTLQNSHINIYDLNGKLIHNQKISDVVTSISTESWPSGVYIWKVTSEDGSEMESGKWVKE